MTDDPPGAGVDQLLAEVMPTLDPAVVREALGWPTRSAGVEGEQTGTGLPT